jgi:hypothetical protein
MALCVAVMQENLVLGLLKEFFDGVFSKNNQNLTY